MKNKKLLKLESLCKIFVIVLLLSSCNRSQEKPNPNMVADQTPKSIIELDQVVLQVLYDIDSMNSIEGLILKENEKENSNQKENVESTEKVASEGSQGSEESKAPEGTEKKDEKSKESKDEEKIKSSLVKESMTQNNFILKLLDPLGIKSSFLEEDGIAKELDPLWHKINQGNEKIHKQWNSAEAELTKINVPNSILREYESTLDDLSLSILNKEILESLILGNELTGISANFRSYFNQSESKIYEMYYHVRKSSLFVQEEKFSDALNEINATSTLGSVLREALIQNKGQDILQKFELSLEDLNLQLNNKNAYLSKLKAEILTKNIYSISEKIGISK